MAAEPLPRLLQVLISTNVTSLQVYKSTITLSAGAVALRVSKPLVTGKADAALARSPKSACIVSRVACHRSSVNLDRLPCCDFSRSFSSSLPTRPPARERENVIHVVA